MRMPCVVMVSLLALGGCATEPASQQVSGGADPVCAAVAADRAHDAAINGFDEQAQQNVRQDAYKSCAAYPH